jgi:hypothetical protein
VYSITPAGRRALRAWLPTASAGPVLEFEALVKVFFAEHASKDDLLATVHGVQEWAEARAVTGLAICREYLEGKGSFPERLPWLILAGRFLYEFEEAVIRWVEWAEAVVGEWPDDVRDVSPDWQALADMAARNEAVVRAATQRRRAVTKAPPPALLTQGGSPERHSCSTGPSCGQSTPPTRSLGDWCRTAGCRPG